MPLCSVVDTSADSLQGGMFGFGSAHAILCNACFSCIVVAVVSCFLCKTDGGSNGSILVPLCLANTATFSQNKNARRVSPDWAHAIVSHSGNSRVIA